MDNGLKFSIYFSPISLSYKYYGDLVGICYGKSAQAIHVNVWL